jgi:L-ascorbate metabolism protein UlaG (beta-lactamase superfamily)
MKETCRFVCCRPIVYCYLCPMDRLKKMLLFTLIMLVVAALGTYLFLQTAVFGAAPAEARLARIQQSKHYRDGAFQNTEPTDVMRHEASYWDMVFDFFRKPADVEPTQPLPTVKTDLTALPITETTIVWFGHSSYLIQAGRNTVLVDPVLSGHASPVSLFGKAFSGTDVYNVPDLPPIDLLVLTHDHYDHLDYETLTALRPKIKQVVTSLGVGAHLARWGYDMARVTELDWDETTNLSEGFALTAVPARHFSGRGIRRGQTLWSAFVMNLNGERFFLGGDSGYGPHFRSIGQQYGPFDLALLECGQYGRDWPSIHMFPNEVALAAKDLGTKVLMPIHWGKFALAFHPWAEPIRQLTAALDPTDSIRLTTPRIGELVRLNHALPQSQWWESN